MKDVSKTVVAWIATIGGISLGEVNALLSILALASTIALTWLTIIQKIRKTKHERNAHRKYR